MKFLITNKSLPDNPRLQDFDELVPLRHFWRSVTITLFVVMIVVILLKLIMHYTLQVDPEYVLPLLQRLVFICVTVILHEVCHMVFLLKYWKELYLVVQPNVLLIGVGVEDFVDRQEILTALAAPLIILSFVPYAAMMMLGHFVMNIFIVVCTNLYISTGDIVAFRFIARNCDRHASVHYSKGFLHIRHAGRTILRGDHEYHN